MTEIIYSVSTWTSLFLFLFFVYWTIFRFYLFSLFFFHRIQCTIRKWDVVQTLERIKRSSCYNLCLNKNWVSNCNALSYLAQSSTLQLNRFVQVFFSLLTMKKVFCLFWTWILHSFFLLSFIYFWLTQIIIGLL